MNIYIAFPLTDEERGLINEVKQPEEKLFWSQDMKPEEQLAAFLAAEVVFGNVSADWLNQTNNLRWMQLYSAGFDPYLNLDWDNALKRTQVTNLRGFFGQPVAETAVAGILALYRRLDDLVLLQDKVEWQGAALRPAMHMLYQKKVVILGAGAIGQSIKEILTAFKCEITIIGRSQSPTLADLDGLLPDSDIVIAALPDTNETKGLFNTSRLATMKSSAILVNVGRGSVIDEEALVNSLKNEKLGGAVLDVTNVEPLPASSSLWKCPGVLLTQHTGGGYVEENADKVRFFVANLLKYRKGDDLNNVVNFAKGY